MRLPRYILDLCLVILCLSMLATRLVDAQYEHVDGRNIQQTLPGPKVTVPLAIGPMTLPIDMAVTGTLEITFTGGPEGAQKLITVGNGQIQGTDAVHLTAGHSYEVEEIVTYTATSTSIFITGDYTLDNTDDPILWSFEPELTAFYHVKVDDRATGFTASLVGTGASKDVFSGFGSAEAVQDMLTVNVSLSERVLAGYLLTFDATFTGALKSSTKLYYPTNPVAQIQGPMVTETGQTVKFDGTGSHADHEIVRYDWNFGDSGRAEGVTASHVYAEAGVYHVTLTVTDEFGATDMAVWEITVNQSLPPVITEHTPGSPMLVLEADYLSQTPGHADLVVWTGDGPSIKPGMFLEYQIAMFSGNPTFRAGVDLYTSDGAALRDVRDAGGEPLVDQNGIGVSPATDLSSVARDQWYHRRIALDTFTGKTIQYITLGTESDQHTSGRFRVYVDNIQITAASGQVLAIYTDQATLPATNTTSSGEPGSAGIEGVTNARLSAAVIGVAVEPVGKRPTMWGLLKQH